MTDLADRLQRIKDSDHERGCMGRQYSCTCGYDDRKDALLVEAAAALALPVASTLSQHIGWLKQFIQGMDETNWQDMRLRAERQLDELAVGFAQQPTAWRRVRSDGTVTYWEKEVPDSTPLYATPTRTPAEGACQSEVSPAMIEAGARAMAKADRWHRWQGYAAQAEHCLRGALSERKSLAGCVKVLDFHVEYTASKGLSRISGWVNREDGERLHEGRDSAVVSLAPAGCAVVQRGPDCAHCECQPRKDCTVPGCSMKDAAWALPARSNGSLQCLRCGTVDAFGPVSEGK